ncbi:MAG: alpha/beta hydrolase [bacterium]|nr:alpha/beta hydrolase [bacterium]
MPFVATPQDPIPADARAVWLEATDGTRFRVARFGPQDAPRGTVVIMNGRTEFVEKYFETIGDLLRRGYAVATLDWRGQGRSDRALQNPHKGHVEDFEHYVSDLRQAVVEFVEPHCPAPYRALCHSMGGAIGLHYLHTHPDTFESAIFSAPMWGIGSRARAAGWMRAVGALTHWLQLHARYLPGGGDYGQDDRTFEDNTLTQDADRFARFIAQIDADPRLALGGPTLGWARQAIHAIDTIHAPGFAEAIRIPIRICSAGRDTLVSGEAHRLVAERLPEGTLIPIQEARHEVLMELDPFRRQFFAAFDAL